MITIKFDNQTLQVEEAKLRQIDFFNSMLNFTKKDTLNVDLPYELVKMILSDDPIDYMNQLFDYLGCNMKVLDTSNIIKMTTTRELKSHGDFAKHQGTKIQFVGAPYNLYFNENMTSWTCEERAFESQDVLLEILHRSEKTKHKVSVDGSGFNTSGGFNLNPFHAIDSGINKGRFDFNLTTGSINFNRTKRSCEISKSIDIDKLRNTLNNIISIGDVKNLEQLFKEFDAFGESDKTITVTEIGHNFVPFQHFKLPKNTKRYSYFVIE